MRICPPLWGTIGSIFTPRRAENAAGARIITSAIFPASNVRSCSDFPSAVQQRRSVPYSNPNMRSKRRACSHKFLIISEQIIAHRKHFRRQQAKKRKARGRQLKALTDLRGAVLNALWGAALRAAPLIHVIDQHLSRLEDRSFLRPSNS